MSKVDDIKEVLERLSLRLSGEGANERFESKKTFEELKSSTILKCSALNENARAIESGEWQSFERMIATNEIFSEDNYAVVVAPYRVYRPGKKQALSVLFCEKTNMAEFPFNWERIEAEYGLKKFTHVIPINIIYSYGNIGSNNGGESFVVPSGWSTLPNAVGSNPFLDLAGARKAILTSANDKFISCMFNSHSAKTLMHFRHEEQRILKAIFWEYSLHEYGHTLGDFEQRFPAIKGSILQAALEEWRCDGVMAALVEKHIQWGNITEVEGRDILMSNFSTRFGVDVARNNAKVDHDFLASYFILSSLERSGKLTWQNCIKLHGNIESYDFWRNLYGNIALEALEVTKKVSKESPLIDERYNDITCLDKFCSMIENIL